MLHIKTFAVNMLQENCYLLYDETNEGVLIDNGAYFSAEREQIIQYIKEKQISLRYQVFTHGHFDHIWGCTSIYDVFATPVCIHQADVALYTNIEQQLQNFMGMNETIAMPPIHKVLTENDTISFGNQQMEIIETPGHTPGGICFYHPTENILISGDSLFYQSIGRTDFPGGNHTDLILSLKKKILILPDCTNVYPGHGPCTTIEKERTGNLYLR